MSSERVCYQVNWQTTIGGGEIYTRFACEALVRRGWRVVLYAHREAAFWRRWNLNGVDLRTFSALPEIESAVPAGSLVLTHNLLDASAAATWASSYRLCGILHMPLFERNPAGAPHYPRLFGVSAHVLRSARERGLRNLHEEPLLGVADIAPRGNPEPIARRSLYDWDRRKLRDRLLASIEGASRTLRPATPFVRREGLTLGIVSRLTPIKQFPALFSILGPVLATFPSVALEIFGAGGYASVRDLKRALEPLGRRARFWGAQSDVATVYRQVDYVLSGLPEKEALGLNLIEAQACGTPVIAVRAAPFTETVVDGATGFLYRDPREDEGADFRAVVERLVRGEPRPDPRLAVAHLAKFSMPAFAERLERALNGVPSP